MTDQSSAPRLQRSSNDLLEATSFLSGTNAQFVESLYAQYLENPDSVDASWRAYFSGLGQTQLDPAALGRGPEWHRDQKPLLANGDLVDALTGQGRPPPRRPTCTRSRRIRSAPSSWCAPIACSATAPPISIRSRSRPRSSIRSSSPRSTALAPPTSTARSSSTA